MKSTVMSYLDNLIAWADNLFASESREALSEATLIYVIASEILGRDARGRHAAAARRHVLRPARATLDAFANAMVEIENVLGGTGDVIATAPVLSPIGIIPTPQTFYFKIPLERPAARLLDDGRRPALQAPPLPVDHGCAARAGAVRRADRPGPADRRARRGRRPLERAHGTQRTASELPFHRAVPAGARLRERRARVRHVLQAALEKVDAGALALLQQTPQQQLLKDGDDVLQLQVQQAQKNIDALNSPTTSPSRATTSTTGRTRRTSPSTQELRCTPPRRS